MIHLDPETCEHRTRVNVCQDCMSYMGSETHDQAWQDGHNTADGMCQEALAEKDEFIEQQAALIQEMIRQSIEKGYRWSADVIEQLRDYV